MFAWDNSLIFLTMELPAWQWWGGLGIKMQFDEWGQSARAVRLVLFGLSKWYPEVKVFIGSQVPNAAGLCLAAISKQVKEESLQRKFTLCRHRHENICKQKSNKAKYSVLMSLLKSIQYRSPTCPSPTGYPHPWIFTSIWSHSKWCPVCWWAPHHGWAASACTGLLLGQGGAQAHICLPTCSSLGEIAGNCAVPARTQPHQDEVDSNINFWL